MRRAIIYNNKKTTYPCNRPWRPIRLWDVEAPTFSLDNRLTDGGEVVSPTRRPPFAPGKIPGTHFCLRLSRPQGHSEAGSIIPIEKSDDLFRNWTRNLTACSILPQSSTLPRVPVINSCLLRWWLLSRCLCVLPEPRLSLSSYICFT
jgi:hypothetical protein